MTLLFRFTINHQPTNSLGASSFVYLRDTQIILVLWKFYETL